MGELMLLALLGLAAWGWQDHLRVRDIARQAAVRMCRERDAGVLDDAVYLHRLSLARGERLPWTLRRVFGFDAHRGGQERWSGRVIVLGHRIALVAFDDELTVDP